ncbi:MAG: 4-phosphoerythronate dehydrogenase [Sedimentisphaerales bacterium]|nr:4-phosphoerythronate dehydrogenase [Sedimentisphaerales bacterium]
MKIIADQNIPFVAECFGSIGEVATMSGREMTAERIADADILLVRSITKVNAALLGGSKIRFVATATIGTDHIDLNYLASEKIGFASAPGSNANSVAEWVVAALLALGKKQRFSLEGKSIGIVGVGNVGSKVEAKCRALGMEVVLNDPPLERQTGDAKYRPLSEALTCDFVTMHVPLTKEGPDKTAHLADVEFFTAMKSGAYFINSSRGGVHDTAALKATIQNQQIAGCILDVWENEPRVDEELLLKAQLSTPHIAGYSFDGKVLGMIMIYEAACRHFGIPVKHTIHDFLPAPEVPEIRIDGPIENEERLIHDIVQQVYAINRDDFNMREILIIPPEQRSKWFDDLRKNYPIRREFQNTTVALPSVDNSLEKKLTGIGFQVKV